MKNNRSEKPSGSRPTPSPRAGGPKPAMTVLESVEHLRALMNAGPGAGATLRENLPATRAKEAGGGLGAPGSPGPGPKARSRRRLVPARARRARRGAQALWSALI